jgi:hypothetical protein
MAHVALILARYDGYQNNKIEKEREVQKLLQYQQ